MIPYVSNVEAPTVHFSEHAIGPRPFRDSLSKECTNHTTCLGAELVKGVRQWSQIVGERLHHLSSNGTALVAHLAASGCQEVHLRLVLGQGDSDKHTQTDGGGEDWRKHISFYIKLKSELIDRRTITNKEIY